MRIFRHFEDLPAEARGAAIAIGNFDGVHHGHHMVIGEAGRIAEAAGIAWAVLTFEPHPRSVFWPDTGPFRLTPFRAKALRIETLGVDFMIALHFDDEFLRSPAEEFVKDVLMNGLGARHVVSGYDFVFGHGRTGNCETLLQMGKEHGFGFTAVQAVNDTDGAVFSSTRVREFLKNADPAAAARMLGRFFEIEGRVVHGDERGRAIGYPTANVALDDYLRPSNGVYAVRVGVEAGEQTKWYEGVANIGHRPTFAGDDVTLEVHLFDFRGDLYGRRLRVAFVEFLRGERKFDGPEELTAQIAEDSLRARRVLAQALPVAKQG